MSVEVAAPEAVLKWPHRYCYIPRQHVAYATASTNLPPDHLILTGWIRHCCPRIVSGAIQRHAEALVHYRVMWIMGEGVQDMDEEGKALFRAMQESLGRITGPFFPRWWTVQEWLLLYEGDAEEDIRTEGASAWSLRQIESCPENVRLSESDLRSFASIICSK
jgi:hypothetical protein